MNKKDKKLIGKKFYFDNTRIDDLKFPKIDPKFYGGVEYVINFL